MKKLSIAVLGLTLFGCASSMKLIGQDPGIRLNRADTLHPVGENVEEMSCGFCEAQSYDSGGKCRATCIYKNQDGTCRSNDFLRMTDFVIDPISTADGQRWANDSLITLSGEAKQWRTLFVSSSEANREQALKRRICSVPTPGLSQTFYLTYPDPPENTPRDQWAQNRQALVGIQKIVLRYFFYYQAFEPTSDLSCYKGNLETGLGQIVQGGTYKSVMDYSQRIPGLKYMGSQIDYAANLKDGKGPNEFVVKVGDSEELQIAFGPLSAKSANFDNFQGHWSRSDIDLKIASGLPALVDDQGETKNHQRALAIRRLWEIDTLRTHYVFVSSGRSLDDSIRVRAEDWKKYLFDNVTIKSEDRAGNQTVKFVVNLDLSGFCKGAEPLYDLTTH